MSSNIRFKYNNVVGDSPDGWEDLKITVDRVSKDRAVTSIGAFRYVERPFKRS
jgi:hypothetical protein